MFNGQDLSTSVLAPDRGHGEVAAVSVHIGRWRVDQSKFKHPVVSLPMSRAALIQTEYLPICMEMDPRRAYREQFFSLFVTDASPTTYSPEIAAVGNNWMLDILRLSTLSPALENGALAVCAARFGKQNRIPGLVRQSLALYTQGLRSFSLEICDESSVQNEQLLAAGMVMLMYEVSECPGGTADAYQQHYKGTMRLLELRGPEAHRSGLGHCVFQSLRVHQVGVFCSCPVYCFNS